MDNVAGVEVVDCGCELGEDGVGVGFREVGVVFDVFKEVH